MISERTELLSSLRRAGAAFLDGASSLDELATRVLELHDQAHAGALRANLV